jgi:hypothetical protein
MGSVLVGDWSGQEILGTVQLFAGSDLGMNYVAAAEGKLTFGIDPRKQILMWPIRGNSKRDRVARQSWNKSRTLWDRECYRG